MSTVDVPTKSSLMHSVKNLGLGALGGALLAFLASLFGAWGMILAPVITGAFMKNDTGRIITTVTGVLAGVALISGKFGGGGGSSGSGGI